MTVTHIKRCLILLVIGAMKNKTTNKHYYTSIRMVNNFYMTILNIGEEGEELDHFYIACGNARW